MKADLIAPCGMNCVLCKGYLREENKCPGCRYLDTRKSGYCRKCIIRNCEQLKKNNWKFCSDKCEKYPCIRLKALDKRYKTKYNMSMINNLDSIQKNGIRKFLQSQKKTWQKDGEIFCVHDKKYYKVN
ncbi:DUF3795 domain-containing protein [Patescibacteria group bacterium]